MLRHLERENEVEDPVQFRWRAEIRREEALRGYLERVGTDPWPVKAEHVVDSVLACDLQPRAGAAADVNDAFGSESSRSQGSTAPADARPPSSCDAKNSSVYGGETSTSIRSSQSNQRTFSWTTIDLEPQASPGPAGPGSPSSAASSHPVQRSPSTACATTVARSRCRLPPPAVAHLDRWLRMRTSRKPFVPRGWRPRPADAGWPPARIGSMPCGSRRELGKRRGRPDRSPVPTHDLTPSHGRDAFAPRALAPASSTIGR